MHNFKAALFFTVDVSDMHLETDFPIRPEMLPRKGESLVLGSPNGHKTFVVDDVIWAHSESASYANLLLSPKATDPIRPVYSRYAEEVPPLC